MYVYVNKYFCKHVNKIVYISTNIVKYEETVKKKKKLMATFVTKE